MIYNQEEKYRQNRSRSEEDDGTGKGFQTAIISMFHMFKTTDKNSVIREIEILKRLKWMF